MDTLQRFLILVLHPPQWQILYTPTSNNEKQIHVRPTTGAAPLRYHLVCSNCRYHKNGYKQWGWLRFCYSRCCLVVQKPVYTLGHTSWHFQLAVRHLFRPDPNRQRAGIKQLLFTLFYAVSFSSPGSGSPVGLMAFSARCAGFINLRCFMPSMRASTSYLLL